MSLQSYRLDSPRLPGALATAFPPGVRALLEPVLAGEWTPITVLQGKGLRSAFSEAKKGNHDALAAQAFHRLFGGRPGAAGHVADGAGRSRRRRRLHGPPPRHLRH